MRSHRADVQFVHINKHDVSLRIHGQTANIIAPQRLGTAQRRRIKDLTCQTGERILLRQLTHQSGSAHLH